MANSVDPDQWVSSEANWSGSTLFAKAGHIQLHQDKGWSGSVWISTFLSSLCCFYIPFYLFISHFNYGIIRSKTLIRIYIFCPNIVFKYICISFFLFFSSSFEYAFHCYWHTGNMRFPGESGIGWVANSVDPDRMLNFAFWSVWSGSTLFA